MNKPDPMAAEPRRVVTKIVLTYTLEGDATQEEHSVTLSSDNGGAPVDGVIWSRSLIERLGYTNGEGAGCKPVPRRRARPEDGWHRRGGRPESAEPESAEPESAIGTAAADDGDNPDCIWLHDPGCTWLSLCDRH
jgi:hypothetical protein